MLTHGLKIVFCGTAASETSAARGEYYAGPGNKFWPVLAEIGLTPRRFSPSEYRDLLKYGIGLTDVVKGQSGGDAQIDFKQSNPETVKQKIHQFSPSILAFNGKKAAQIFLDERRVEFGLQAQKVGTTRLYVAPSTSGAANGYWDLESWRELAKLAHEVAI